MNELLNPKDLYIDGSLINHMVQERTSMEVMLELLKEKSHVREISRKLNQSHVNIIRSLAELVRQNVVDFEQEGRNKTYFIKNTLSARSYVYQAEYYKLSKLIEEYPKLSVILQDVIKKIDSSLIILFGSYAKFIPKKDSDIDIYVETRNEKVKTEIKHINSDINAQIGEFNTDSLLIKEIIKNHVILKGVEEFYGRIKFFT